MLDSVARTRTIILLSRLRSAIWAAIVALSIHNYWRAWPPGGLWLEPGVCVVASLIMQQNCRSILAAWLVSVFWMLLGVVLNIYFWCYLAGIGASAWQSLFTIVSLCLFTSSLVISMCGTILVARRKDDLSPG
jgi:hypothetical protein